MKGNTKIPGNLKDAEALLTGRNKWSRKVGDSTFIGISFGTVYLTYMDRVIAVYQQDGGVRLSTHGTNIQSLDAQLRRMSEAIAPMTLVRKGTSLYIHCPSNGHDVKFHQRIIAYPKFGIVDKQ